MLSQKLDLCTVIHGSLMPWKYLTISCNHLIFGTISQWEVTYVSIYCSFVKSSIWKALFEVLFENHCQQFYLKIIVNSFIWRSLSTVLFEDHCQQFYLKIIVNSLIKKSLSFFLLFKNHWHQFYLKIVVLQSGFVFVLYFLDKLVFLQNE